METPEISSDTQGNARPYAKTPGSAGGRRARQDFSCGHCGRTFNAKPVHDHRGVRPRRFCSKRCAGAHRTALSNARRMNAAPEQVRRPREQGVAERPAQLIDMSAAAPLTAAQSAKVRSYVFGLLRAQIPFAHRVVMGEVEWSPTQARVFATLLDKCLPDLSASFVDGERRDSELCVMSRRDLELLAAGADTDGSGCHRRGSELGDRKPNDPLVRYCRFESRFPSQAPDATRSPFGRGQNSRCFQGL